MVTKTKMYAMIIFILINLNNCALINSSSPISSQLQQLK
jgi:hypothetical protein